MRFEFPYVRPCGDCGGWGYKFFNEDAQIRDGMIFKLPGVRKEECRTCKGKGAIIPPEWIDNG